MKKYKLYNSNNYLFGEIEGITKAKKILATMVRDEKKLANRKLYCHWDKDKTDCILTLGADKNSSLWDRLGFNEV